MTAATASWPCCCTLRLIPEGPATYSIVVNCCADRWHTAAACRARARFFMDRARGGQVGNPVAELVRLFEHELARPEPSPEPWRRPRYAIARRTEDVEGEWPGSQERTCSGCHRQVTVPVRMVLEELTLPLVPICGQCADYRTAQTGDHAWTFVFD